MVPGGGFLMSEPGRGRLTDDDGTTLATYPANDPYGVALAGDTVLIADASERPDPPLSDRRRRAPGVGRRPRGPRGLATDPDGTVYVADAGRWRIETFAADGKDTGGWRVPDPHGVAVDAGETVYVATHHPGAALVRLGLRDSGAIGGTRSRAASPSTAAAR